jgi:hypothetical protein
VKQEEARVRDGCAQGRVPSLLGKTPGSNERYFGISSATMTYDDNETLVVDRVADKSKLSINIRSVAVVGKEGVEVGEWRSESG